VAAAFLIAAGAAGSALASSHWAKADSKSRGHGSFVTSLVPHFAPHRRAWLKAFGEVSHGRKAHHQNRQQQPEPAAAAERHHPFDLRADGEAVDPQEAGLLGRAAARISSG